MKRVGVYPGSFFPFHLGHRDVLLKAMQVFDEVVILQMCNPAKGKPELLTLDSVAPSGWLHRDKVFVDHYPGLLRDFLIEHPEVTGVIRGLRNGHDMEDSIQYQYWNEDLGVEVPFVHFISDRAWVHYSSSAIRGLESFGVGI